MQTRNFVPDANLGLQPDRARQEDGGVTLVTPVESLANTEPSVSDTSWCLPRLRARTAHCEASRRVSVRLSACARVSYPKAAPIAVETVKRRTHERLRVQTRCRLAG